MPDAPAHEFGGNAGNSVLQRAVRPGQNAPATRCHQRKPRRRERNARQATKIQMKLPLIELGGGWRVEVDHAQRYGLAHRTPRAGACIGQQSAFGAAVPSDSKTIRNVRCRSWAAGMIRGTEWEIRPDKRTFRQEGAAVGHSVAAEQVAQNAITFGVTLVTFPVFANEFARRLTIKFGRLIDTNDPLGLVAGAQVLVDQHL